MISDNSPAPLLPAGNKARVGLLIGLVAASAGGGCSTSDQQAILSNATINVTNMTPEQRHQLQLAQQQQDASESENDSDNGAGGGTGGGSTDPNDPNNI